MDSSSCVIGSYLPPKPFYILAVLSLSFPSLSSSAHTTSMEGGEIKKKMHAIMELIQIGFFSTPGLNFWPG